MKKLFKSPVSTISPLGQPVLLLDDNFVHHLVERLDVDWIHETVHHEILGAFEYLAEVTILFRLRLRGDNEKNRDIVALLLVNDINEAIDDFRRQVFHVLRHFISDVTREGESLPVGHFEFLDWLFNHERPAVSPVVTSILMTNALVIMESVLGDILEVLEEDVLLLVEQIPVLILVDEDTASIGLPPFSLSEV